PLSRPKGVKELRSCEPADRYLSDQRHPCCLLRARGERPPRGHAAEQGDEFAAIHSITSPARADSIGGTTMPSAFAVVRLMTNSNFVDCATGRSAGFSPLRIRPV